MALVIDSSFKIRPHLSQALSPLWGFYEVWNANLGEERHCVTSLNLQGNSKAPP
jgi:hypothetical protein